MGLTGGRRLVRQELVWDNHVCLPHRPDSSWFDRLEEHRRADVDFVSLNLGDAEVPLETQVRMAAFFRARVAAMADRYVMAATVDDIEHARATGRMAVAFDVEGAFALDGQLDLVPVYAMLGVRWMLLAFNRANAAGSGVHDAVDGGLTRFGRDLLDALDANRIVACCSHTGYRTASDAVAHQAERGRTIVVSHSNARALDDHPRNVPDSLIDAVALVDGVVGVNGLSIFLGGAADLAERYADHVSYVADRVGPRHVGIGLDYVYDQADMDAQLLAARGTWPDGYGYAPGIRYMPPDALARVVDILLARGWGDADVAAFLGGNFARVARRVWK